MATGAPGTNGVWQYGEDDSEATFSALLNKAASTTDTAIGLDRARLTALEGAGRIVNVVSVTKTNEFSVSLASGAFSANVTGLDATITPKASNNKILVSVSVVLARGEGRGIGAFRIVRNGTAIGVGDAASTRPRVTSGVINDFANNNSIQPVSSQFLDSPNSTSALTYGVQLYGIGPATFTLNRTGTNDDSLASMRTISTITLIEVDG